MADVHNQATRSRNMAAIRGKHTKPEMLVRKALHRAGLRYRLHTKLPGRPDLVFPKLRTVLFVHGCFWHRHDCPNGKVVPATRKEFWQAKFDGNVHRDQHNRTTLTAAGWRVLVIWECEIDEERLSQLVEEIKSTPINSASSAAN